MLDFTTMLDFYNTGLLANDANADMEKEQRKGFIHPFVQDYMIYIQKFIFGKTDF